MVVLALLLADWLKSSGSSTIGEAIVISTDAKVRASLLSVAVVTELELSIKLVIQTNLISLLDMDELFSLPEEVDLVISISTSVSISFFFTERCCLEFEDDCLPFSEKEE